MTPSGQVQAQRYGNGLVQTNQFFNAIWQMQNTFIDDLQPGSPDFMNYFYQYDLFGNVSEQTSHNLRGIGGEATVDQEGFVYDRLHRLTSSTRMHSIGNANPTVLDPVSYVYDAIGNIRSKNDYATGYEYNNGRPNAVTRVTPVAVGSSPITYSYDDNGNMTSGSNGRTMVYNVYNKPVEMTNAGGGSNEFWYDADEQRYLQRKNGGPLTHYVDKSYERTGDVHKLYMSDFAVFTVDYANSDNTGITYLHKDRLGSVAVMSTSQQEPINGTSKGYDPFGKPRDGDWMDGDGDLNGYEESTRGFTGHEHLNETDLIHMNGRTYDYSLGRFLSVDPVIQAPSNSQSLNPYSYIMNNPLSGTDPTGYTSFGLNGGKCNDFSSGSCSSAFFGDGTDERQNRRNGAKAGGKGETPMASLDNIGSTEYRDNTDTINAINQMTSSTEEEGERVLVGDICDEACEIKRDFGFGGRLRKELQEPISIGVEVVDAIVTPDAVDVVLAPIAPVVAINKARKGVKGADAASDIRKASDTEAIFSTSQLDRKFKHASDFGITTTKKNPETLASFESAIRNHLGSSATSSRGTYGFVPNSQVFFNSVTNNAVVLDSTGVFVTGFKLSPGTKQYENFINNGVLR